MNEDSNLVLIKRFGELTPPELVELQRQYDRCELDGFRREWRFYNISRRTL